MEKRKAKVLIADDEAHIRSLVNIIITSLGADVVAEASDGEVALSLFEQHLPDMVVLDINMPKMDGVAVLKKIMSIKPRTMVVVLSSLNALEVVKECIDIGAWNYILKNATPAELQSELSESWKSYMAELGASMRS